MPNWVFNTVTISGDKHALNSFMERAKQPYDVHGETRSEELSFWNFEKLVALHPELSFELRYSEEQGWGGEEHGEGGVHWVVDEWDVPQSHADRMEHLNWCYCEEMREDELKDAYDDCPRKMELANS